MADFLADMAAASRARLAAARARRDLDALLRLAERASTPPPLRLHERFDVIAEIKAHSPAEGALADSATLDRRALAGAYADAGALAISVLTEPDRFGGELQHLADVATALGAAVAGTAAPGTAVPGTAVPGTHSTPVMRKDFLVDEYQVVEARLAGAGGVLLIVAMLDDATLLAMLRRAVALGLFILLECFDAADIRRSERLLAGQTLAHWAGQQHLLLGINTRDLRTLAVDADRLERLAPLLPDGIVAVAESGLAMPEDAARARALGYRVALIGTALMKSATPGALLTRFITAGRAP